MSTTQHIDAAATSTEPESYELDSVGIEFEYPVVGNPTDIGGRGNDHGQIIPESDAPATMSATSGALRNHYGRNSDWLPGHDFDGGYMGSDHTGSEITSGILDLHSDEPERWFKLSVEAAEDAGYPYAASGYGQTIFGMHTNLSYLPSSKRNAIADAMGNEWARVFFCSSVNYLSLDPWRHGGVGSPSSPWGFEGERREFRLAEPVTLEHFGLMMDFWRLVETHGTNFAIDFAEGLVYDRDPRLTAVRQYNQLAEANDDWPNEAAVTEDGQTDPEVALWFRDLME